MAAQRPLEPLILVRVQAPLLPPPSRFMRPVIEENPPENNSKIPSEPGHEYYVPFTALFLISFK